MKKRTVFDRMVEDQDFYVRVQKSKLVLVVVLLAIAGVIKWLQ
jgi:hypothetical protein